MNEQPLKISFIKKYGKAMLTCFFALALGACLLGVYIFGGSGKNKNAAIICMVFWCISLLAIVILNIDFKRKFSFAAMLIYSIVACIGFALSVNASFRLGDKKKELDEYMTIYSSYESENRPEEVSDRLFLLMKQNSDARYKANLTVGISLAACAFVELLRAEAKVLDDKRIKTTEKKGSTFEE